MMSPVRRSAYERGHTGRGSARTSCLLRLLPEPLFECPLLLQRAELLRFAGGVALRVVVLGKDAVSVRVNDDECRNGVE